MLKLLGRFRHAPERAIVPQDSSDLADLLRRSIDDGPAPHQADFESAEAELARLVALARDVER